MSYVVTVTFCSSDDSLVFTLADTISEDFCTCGNYWDDICEFVSHLISLGESLLRKNFPKGHSYSLFDVSVSSVGGDTN